MARRLSDLRLEELRKFLTRRTDYTPSAIIGIVNDLSSAVEELQLRRVQERTPLGEPAKPLLIFGSTENAAAYVKEHQPKFWRRIFTPQQLLHAHPVGFTTIKLDATVEPAWQAWQDLLEMYKPGTRAVNERGPDPTPDNEIS